MAPPIATPMPQRRGDGFTIMEGKLTTLFLDQFKSKSATVEGLTHTTRRHLTTALSVAVNSKGPPKSAVQSTQSPVKDHLNRRYNLHNLFKLHQITPPRVISPPHSLAPSTVNGHLNPRLSVTSTQPLQRCLVTQLLLLVSMDSWR
jgi:hypothetical protein